MTYEHDRDPSAPGSPAGDLDERIDFACTYHKVTREDIQDRMHVVRGLARDLGHQLVEILPRCPERDMVAETVVDLCQDAIGALARYQELIPEPMVEALVSDRLQVASSYANVGTEPPTQGMPTRYVDPSTVVELISRAHDRGIAVPQIVNEYRQVMTALQES